MATIYEGQNWSGIERHLPALLEGGALPVCRFGAGRSALFEAMLRGWAVDTGRPHLVLKINNAGIKPVSEGRDLDELSLTEPAVVRTLHKARTRLRVEMRDKVQVGLTRPMVLEKLGQGGLFWLMTDPSQLPEDMHDVLDHPNTVVTPIKDYREGDEEAAENAYRTVEDLAAGLTGGPIRGRVTPGS